MMPNSSEMEVLRVAIEPPGSPAYPAFAPLPQPTLRKNAQSKRKKARQMKKNGQKWADIKRSVHLLSRRPHF